MSDARFTFNCAIVVVPMLAIAIWAVYQSGKRSKAIDEKLYEFGERSRQCPPREVDQVMIELIDYQKGLHLDCIQNARVSNILTYLMGRQRETKK